MYDPSPIKESFKTINHEDQVDVDNPYYQRDLPEVLVDSKRKSSKKLKPVEVE